MSFLQKTSRVLLVGIVVFFAFCAHPQVTFARPWTILPESGGGINVDNTPHGHVTMTEQDYLDLGPTPVYSVDWAIRQQGAWTDTLFLDHEPLVYVDDPAQLHPVTHTSELASSDGRTFDTILHIPLDGWFGRHAFTIVYDFQPLYRKVGDKAVFTMPIVLAENGEVTNSDSTVFVPRIYDPKTLKTLSSYSCLLGGKEVPDCFHASDVDDFVTIPITKGQDFFVTVSWPQDLALPVGPAAAFNPPRAQPAQTKNKQGMRVITSLATTEPGFNGHNDIKFSADDKLKIVFAYLAGFFLQVLYMAISRKLTFKEIFKLLGSSFLWFLLGLLPGKHEHHYNLITHVFFGTVLSGFLVFGFFQNKFAPRISEFTFLVWSLLIPYLLFENAFNIYVIAFGSIPFLLALINIYTDIDRFSRMRVFFYILFIILIISGSIIHIRGSDLRFFFNPDEWYPYTIANFFFFGGLIAYTMPYLGFLGQFMQKKKEPALDYQNRKAKLIQDIAADFDHTRNFPLMYTLTGLAIGYFFYYNFTHHLVSVSLAITIVVLFGQIVDSALGQNTPHVVATEQPSENVL